jgi:nucleotide-binding universal stress UspA family protein
MAQVYRARLADRGRRPAPPLLAWQAPGGDARRARRPSSARLEDKLRQAADNRPRRSLRVGPSLLVGDPARELLRAARDGEHDLIVMGSRGRGRVTRRCSAASPTT